METKLISLKGEYTSSLNAIRLTVLEIQEISKKFLKCLEMMAKYSACHAKGKF